MGECTCIDCGDYSMTWVCSDCQKKRNEKWGNAYEKEYKIEKLDLVFKGVDPKYQLLNSLIELYNNGGIECSYCGNRKVWECVDGGWVFSCGCDI